MSVLEKIRKIRAVAERSTHEHEVYAAMLLAQRLMAEHGLQEADLAHDGSEADSPHGPVEHATLFASARYTAWKDSLAVVIASNMRCTTYIHRGVDGVQVRLLGRRQDVQIVCEIYRAAYDAALRLADTYIKAHQSNARARGKRRPVTHWRLTRVSFYQGFVSGLQDQFASQRDAHPEWALVLAQDEMVRAEAQATLSGKPMQSRARWGYNRESYGAGYAAGYSLDARPTTKIPEGLGG